MLYELVHDGFGSAFTAWADAVREEPGDSVATITALRGADLAWPGLRGRIWGVCWRGCWIGPQGADPLVLEGVEFDECDLRGTIFERCIFRGGMFRNSNIDGVVFRQCRFEDADGQPVTFDQLRADSVTFYESELRHVVFRDSHLHNLSLGQMREGARSGGDPPVAELVFERCVINKSTIGPMGVSGQVAVRSCWVGLSDLSGLAMDGGESARWFSATGCTFVHCHIPQVLVRSIDSSGTNRRFPEDTSLPSWSNETSDHSDPWRLEG